MNERGALAAEFCARLPLVGFLVWGSFDKPKEITVIIGNEDKVFTLIGEELIAETLKQIFSSDTSLLISYDLKTTQSLLANLNIAIDHTLDIALIEGLIQNDVNRHLQGKLPSWNELVGKYLNADPEIVCERAYEILPKNITLDAHTGKKIAALLKIFYAQLELVELFEIERAVKIEAEAAPVLGMMEYSGIYVNRERLQALIEQLVSEKNLLKSRMDAVFANVVGKDLFGAVTISYESDEEVRSAAQKLGIHIPDFKKETLFNLKTEFGKVLWNYREAAREAKLLENNFSARLDVHSRIHPHFHSLGAVSGRMAVENPNVHSVPKDPRYRRIFSGPPQRIIITADYSAIEMRIMAQTSGDKALIAALQPGKDFHSTIASRLFGVEVSKTKQPHLRNRAKVVSFGICYGMGVAGLAATLGIAYDDARVLLDRYFDAMPRVKKYFEISVRQSFQRHYARTLSGRILKVSKDELKDQQLLSEAERTIRNMPLQGTNADILKIALARMTKEFVDQKIDAFIVNCVHDEVVVEAKKSEYLKAKEIVKHEMISAAHELITLVPVEVEISAGEFWGDNSLPTGEAE